MTLEMQTALERELKDAKTPAVICAPGTNGLNVRPADIDLLAGEIRTAQTELDNAAALAKANSPAPAAKEGGAA